MATTVEMDIEMKKAFIADHGPKIGARLFAGLVGKKRSDLVAKKEKEINKKANGNGVHV